MYCSSSDEVDYMCNETTNPMKNGFPKLGIPGIETLLWRYNVDVAIWAHEHNYERMWPVYDGKVKNGSSQVCFCVSNYSANVCGSIVKMRGLNCCNGIQFDAFRHRTQTLELLSI